MKDITFITDKSKLAGTCYIEIVPGKYQQKHWQDDSLFFTEETFGLIEPIFKEYINNYDHYGINNVPKNVWVKIIDALKVLNKDLIGIKDIEGISKKVYFFYSDTQTHFEKNAEQNKASLIQMNTDFIAWIEQTLNEHDFIAVLGL